MNPARAAAVRSTRNATEPKLDIRSLREFSLIALSTALLVLPFHFSFLWPLSFVAFLPFFYLLDSKTPTAAFKISYLFGFLFYASLGFWLTLVNVLGFFILAAYLASYFAVFGWVSSYFLNPSNDFFRTNLRKNVKVLLFVPAFWVVSEYLRGWIISGMPWSLLAYSQWKNFTFIQLADLTGAYGVSYLVLFINLLLFKLLRTIFPNSSFAASSVIIKNNRWPFLKTFSSILVFTLIAVNAYGWIALGFHEGPDLEEGAGRKLRISVLQGNIPQDQKWNTKIKNIIFEKYKRLTTMAAQEKSDLILWPETSFPGYLENEPLLASRLRSVIRSAKTNVLVGAPTIGDIEQGLRFYNSAILYGANGQEKQRYHKVHLVPFGEYIPLEPVLGFLRRFFPIGRFSHGQEKTIFTIQSHFQEKKVQARFGVLICYEDIFPGLVRDFANKDADFLINITNDAWFGKTSAPYQHAQASVFRAIENRIPIVRSTNTGYSCFISPTGRILARVVVKAQEIFVTGHKSHELVIKSAGSFYKRFGDIFVFVCMFLCFLAYIDHTKRPSYARV